MSKKEKKAKTPFLTIMQAVITLGLIGLIVYLFATGAWLGAIITLVVMALINAAFPKM